MVYSSRYTVSMGDEHINRYYYAALVQYLHIKLIYSLNLIGFLIFMLTERLR